MQATSSVVGNAGAVAALLTLEPELAHQLYAEHFVGATNLERQRPFWGDPNDLYAQEWAWYATALYAGALPNLWHLPDYT